MALVELAESIGHELFELCTHCHTPLRVVPGQIIVRDRLAWSISSTCHDCGAYSECCGWDEMPKEPRQAVLDRDGAARIRIDPESARLLRLPILRVLRRYGATLSEALDTFACLTGTGLTGTSAEIRLLANRLDTTGAAIQMDL